MFRPPERHETERIPSFRVLEQFTQGKGVEHNEDAAGIAADRLILSDGATDKNGFRHDNVTGGELAARAVVNTCLNSSAYGVDLVNEASAAIRSQYENINPRALHDSAYRYGATLVDARIVSDMTPENEPTLVITMVGDSGARIIKRNGDSVLLYETKPVDIENGKLRAAYIQKHPDDIEGGRGIILDRLKQQHRLQNVPTNVNAHDYGVLCPKNSYGYTMFPLIR